MIPDDMLCAAATRSCEIYMERYISCYDARDRHTFSLRFERKIKKLKRKADHPIFYQAMQRIASVLLAFLVGVSVWLAVDVEARAAVFGWIKGFYESFFVYRFEENSEEPAAAGAYRPTWLPDGYTEVFADETTESIFVIYANEDNEMLKFQYVQNPIETDWAIDFSLVEKCSVDVNGQQADLLISSSADTSNSILWSTSDKTAFYISAFLDGPDLIRIAESVQRTEK